ncbi:MAG: alpha-glucan family phosphorylase [Acidobacteria bacterium]|nr:alpha-glucan family phosphorylase [Acidobacteriota bacterium]
MKEISTETFTNMQPALGVESEQTFRNDFYFKRELPENLQFLETLSWNFFWSWKPDGVNLFRELDPALWEKCEQNPRVLLKNVKELQLWQKANDTSYVAKLQRFAEEFENYHSPSPKSFGKIMPEKPVAYFCAEYGVHNSLPIYSGGLGILAGDHLKSASDGNVPLVAVGLLYRYGYFRQKIAHDGWQEERYSDSFANELALQPVLNENSERILVMIHIRGRTVFAQAWLAQIGRISLYLLDTNIAENDEIDRLITGHLYGGDTETRIVQEKILGIGGVRLLRKLGIEPVVYHLNEGHSAFLTLELAREFLEGRENAGFADAVSFVKEKCVFTTHTPVAAGNDNFPLSQIKDCFDANFISSLKISEEQLYELGRTNPDDKSEWFGMTPLAIRLTRSANGVSKKHGEVSRQLWLKVFPEITQADNVPITYITNGVHAPTWVAPSFQIIYEKYIGKHWAEVLHDAAVWRAGIEKIPDAEIWNAHQLIKQLLISFIRLKTFSTETGLHDTINEHENTSKLFSADILTIGFARRIAAYKRWNLLLSDLERLLKMVDNVKKPVQFVFAGKAHPQDRAAKLMLQNLLSLDENSQWQRRAVFLEDYDQEVARYLVQGVDVWLNVPRRPLEASGTSGQKLAMNGGLNLSILDGWWIEGYNGENGFAIGVLQDDNEKSQETIDAEDAESLYQILETEVIPAYYAKNENGLHSEWIRRMKNALITLTPQFSSDRMVKDYIEKIYTLG